MKKARIILIFVTLLTACSMSKINKYEWLASGSADKLYPTELFFGNFILLDDYKLYIPSSAVFETDWGKHVSTHISGPEFKPVPKAIEIVWYSIMENKFYSVEADLPHEKIDALMKLKDEKTKKHVYRRINAGMSLYGNLAIFLEGAGILTEVAWIEGKEVEVEWLDFMPSTASDRAKNREEYSDFIKKDCKKAYENYLENGMPDNMLFENNRKKFNYRITLDFENENAVLELVRIQYYSGEYNFTNSGEHVNNAMRAKPRKFIFEWSVGSDKYQGHFWTDENKIIETFANFFGSDTQKAGNFLIEIGEDSKEFKISLQNDDKVYEIPEEDIQILVFKNRLECFRSKSYNKPPGGWRD